MRRTDVILDVDFKLTDLYRLKKYLKKDFEFYSESLREQLLLVPLF